MPSLTVESWRSIPHSYAIVNQFQCLELLKIPGLTLTHRDLPYLDSCWQPQPGLFSPQDEQQLQAIPAPRQDTYPDAVLRLSFPFDFSDASAGKTIVFGTTECGIVPLDRLKHNDPEAIDHFEGTIATPSHWSKQGFIRSGVRAEQIEVVPHGVATKFFHPVDPNRQQQLKQHLGWEGFTFLNVSSMLPSKGITHLIQAFANITDTYPDARLVLKGADDIYPDGADRVGEALLHLSSLRAQRVIERITYIGESLSFNGLAELYQAADMYASPYLAEGFNLPVLEAIACGLPVICTQGGPTDDFTLPEFALTIESTLTPARVNGNRQGYVLQPSIDHLTQQMIASIENTSWRNNARKTGASYVQNTYSWEQVTRRLLEVALPELALQCAVG